MDLIMFDIDGTLTRTFPIDGECYVQAVAEISGFGEIPTDWAAYRHVTDSGILDEVYQSRLGRPPKPEEILAVRDRFIQLLGRAASRSPGAFAPLPGAQDFIEHLLASGCAVSLATGGWQLSARLKLATAGLHLEALPAAFADDALARRDIMQKSYQRAGEAHRVTAFDSVTYIGDASWDAKASLSLDYKFLGIGSGDRDAHLRQLGAVDVFADYSDIRRLKDALERRA